MDRRSFLQTGAAFIASSGLLRSAPAVCALMSEQEEGPYYVDYQTIRQNITEGKPGLPLRLRVQLVNAKTCAPLSNAALDIWHCDAGGVYSGFTSNNPDGPLGGPGGPGGFGPPPGGPPPGGPPPGGPMGRPFGHHGALDKTRFLRGVQISNQDGMVEFVTVYPGWYAGRSIHIHCKVHTGAHVAHTGQFFFPEDITESVAKLAPYAKRLGVYRTRQNEDFVFTGEHGASGMLKLARLESRTNASGFTADALVAVDPEANPKPVGMGGPPRG